MGNQIDPTTGKLLFDNTAGTVADLQALADWQKKYVGVSVANFAALADISPRWEGIVAETRDTDTLWLCTDPSGSGTWVPAGGQMPFIDLVAATQQASAAGNTTVSIWGAPGVGASINPFSEWFSVSGGDITVKRAGRYRLMARVLIAAQSSGGGPAGFWLNSSQGIQSQDAVTTLPSLGVMAKLDAASVYLPTNAVVNVISIGPTAGLTLGGQSTARSSGEFSIQYVGP